MLMISQLRNTLIMKHIVKPLLFSVTLSLVNSHVERVLFYLESKLLKGSQYLL